MANAASILYAMALDAGLTPAEISIDDALALAAANDADCGIWIEHGSEQTFISAMDEIARSIGAWYGFDETGVLRMGQLSNDIGNSEATLTSKELQDISARPDKDIGRPAWRVVLDYSKNYTVQQTDIAGSVTDARRAFLAEHFRTVSVEEETIRYWGHGPLPNIRGRCLLAIEPRFVSLMVDEADAQAEVERLWNMYAVKHHILDVKVHKDWYVENGPFNLMDIIRVTFPSTRLNGIGSNLYRLLGIRLQLAREQVTLSLWSIEASGP